MPDPLDTDVAGAALHGRTPTSIFLERWGRRLDPILRRYLEACLVSPFGFDEVVAVEPGSGFRARDVFIAEDLMNPRTPNLQNTDGSRWCSTA